MFYGENLPYIIYRYKMKISELKTFHLQCNSGEHFEINFSWTKKEQSPLVIFLHGFKGFKDWGHYNLLDGFFHQRGISFMRMNFSHNGTSLETPIEFSRLDLFGNNTFSKEIGDIDCLLKFIEENLSQEINLKKINLMGHSRGGSTAIIYSSISNKINSLITLAAVANLERMLTGFAIEKWKENGVVYTKNARTNQDMPLNYSLYEDYYFNREKYNPLIAANKINIPWIAFHGTADAAVPIKDLQDLILSNEKIISEFIEGADHTFGGTHPWNFDYLPKHTEFIMEKIANFILKNS